MPIDQTKNKRDILIAGLGTAPNNVIWKGRSKIKERYQLADKYCTVQYLLIDTAPMAKFENIDQHFEHVWQIRLADDKGKENTKLYLSDVIIPLVDDLKVDGILPKYVDLRLLNRPLIQRMEAEEASKDPLKGYLYFLGNLPIIDDTLRLIKQRMNAPTKDIYLVYSPVSGTGAGAWLLMTALLMHHFEHTSPILVNMLPSHLKGSPKAVRRNHAIFGWNAKLLNELVLNGIHGEWKIWQREGDPIIVKVSSHKEPLFVYLQSSYRRRGEKHLSGTEAFFDVLAEQIPLIVIGSNETRARPSADSEITNLETDARLDEESLPSDEKPRRGYLSRGFCALRYNSVRARNFTKGEIVYKVIDRLLRDSSQVQLRNRVQARLRQRIFAFYRYWDDVIQSKRLDLPEDYISKMQNEEYKFSNDIKDFIQGIVKELFKDLWNEISKLVEKDDGCSIKDACSALATIEIDDEFVRQALQLELDRFNGCLESAITVNRAKRGDGLQKLTTIYSDLPDKVKFDTWMSAVQSGLRLIVLNLLQSLYLVTLRNICDYIKVQLEQIIHGLGAIQEAAKRKREEYQEELRNPEKEQAYDISAREASKIIEKQRLPLLLRSILAFIGTGLAETIPEDDIIEEQRLQMDFKGVKKKQDLESYLNEAIDEMLKVTPLSHGIEALFLELINDRDLMERIINKARAATQLEEANEDVNWSIWYSGDVEHDLKIRLQNSMKECLRGEPFKLIPNDGFLPLIDPDSAEIILAETACSFPLRGIRTDKSMEEYWREDTVSLHRENLYPIHRVQAGFVEMDEGEEK